MGVSALTFIVYGALSFVTDPLNYPEGSILPATATLGALLLGVFFEMALLNFALRSLKSAETVTARDAFTHLPFWTYCAVKILTTLATILGLIALIVPGIIVSLGLMFATYRVIDAGKGPVDAMRESWQMTKGSRFRLLLFVLALGALNILGALALFIGLLVSAPVSMFAMAHAYRALQGSEAVQTA